ncbi:MAG: (2Fe-2S) ferredoxin domain-containing protein [bacterium]
MTEPYYQRHVFFCANQRDGARRCCADHAADDCRDYAKKRMKAIGRHGRSMVRINRSGCLDRCDQGPVLVVYPEAVWYTYVDHEDIDEIIDQHLLHGRIVERLRI